MFLTSRAINVSKLMIVSLFYTLEYVQGLKEKTKLEKES